MRLNPGRKPYRVNIIFLLATLLWAGHGFAQLQANFTMDKAGGCSPISVAFTNTTTGASSNAVYTWDLGNGNRAISFNAGAIYKNEKSYTVSLTVQDGSKTSVKTQTITVYAKPTIDFSVSPSKVCLPTPINFTAGSGNIASYYWDFGDGSTQQTFGPVIGHVYTVAQKATVSLTVANSFGCTNTIQKQDIVEIIPTISAYFKASQTILCRETDAVQFTNYSSGPGTLSYLWDFGDGTTSTDIAPSHVFNGKGIYTVKLTTTSSEGCIISNTQSGYINVATFNSDFNVPPVICKDGYNTFNSISTPYSNNSLFEVDGNIVSYSGYLNYQFNTTGDHTIKLKNTFGTCPDSITKTVSVKPIPVPDGFENNILNTCGAPVTVNFKDTTATAVKWAWNFDASYNPTGTDATTQTASHLYTSDGGYLVRLTVTNPEGCSQTTSKYVGITRPSVYITSAGAITNCGPYKMTFTSHTTEEIISYSWAFSDGAVSTDKEPEHLFTMEGINSVQLTYTTKNGCTGTVSTGGFRVYKMPTAAFSASSTTICGNTPVSFNAVPQGNDVYFYWTLGDNASPYFNFNYPSLLHQYNTDGLYSITLVATNGGCSDTVTKKDYMTVLPPFPKIAAAANTCDGTRGLVNFTQSSKKVTGNWVWDFGDNNTATFNTDVPNVSHTYTKTGTYKAVLSTTNGQCTVRDSTVVSVLLKQNPALTASAAEVCFDNRVDIKIDNLDRNPRGDNVSNHYNFQRIEYGDGSPFAGSLNNSFPGFYWSTLYTGSAGNFNRAKNDLRIIVTSTFFACNDTTNYIPLAIKGAAAGFEVVTDNVCFKSPVVLRDTSKSFGNTIKTWQWSFGDNTTQTVTQGGLVTHTYTNPGNYYVSVKVTDNGGCTSTSSSPVYVSVSGPKASFSVSNPTTTITLPVYFYNYSNTYNSPATQCKWDFGDGATSADYSPTHAYTNPGTYKIQLIVINPATQCSDTAYQQITVNNFKPAFAFTTSYLSLRNCPPVLARFSNNSVNYTRVTWDFGDGTTADNLNFPSHVYENSGKYIVKLYVYGPATLIATYTDSVIVNQPEATMQTSDLEGCIGYTPTLTSVTKNANLYAWDFGDGALSIPGDSVTSHQYMTPGVYKPVLMVSQTGGCTAVATLPNQVTVHPNPVVTISPAQPLVCKGTPIQLTASGGSAYAWSPATGLSDAGIAAPLTSPDNTTTYTVLVKDNLGCSNTGSITVKVVSPFTITVPEDAFVCKGSAVQLNVTGAPLYNWIDNTNGLSNTQISNPIARPSNDVSYTVVGADIYHCFTDTAIIKVHVVPLPTVTASQPALVFPGTPVQLSATISSDVVKWKWSPGTYLNCMGCLTPTSTPMAETTYTITVNTKEGCSASDTTVIKLICEENRVSIPTAFTPNGDRNNEVFTIKGISVIKHLIIYNRWGNKVFERSNFIAADKSNGRNGTINGIPCPEGVYVYYAEMQCPTGASFVRKGTVILMR
jgi:gliding motility-associated-like protein